MPCALFWDTMHRRGEALLVAVGVHLGGEKMALSVLQGLLRSIMRSAGRCSMIWSAAVSRSPNGSCS